MEAVRLSRKKPGILFLLFVVLCGSGLKPARAVEGDPIFVLAEQRADLQSILERAEARGETVDRQRIHLDTRCGVAGCNSSSLVIYRFSSPAGQVNPSTYSWTAVVEQCFSCSRKQSMYPVTISKGLPVPCSQKKNEQLTVCLKETQISTNGALTALADRIDQKYTAAILSADKENQASTTLLEKSRADFATSQRVWSEQMELDCALLSPTSPNSTLSSNALQECRINAVQLRHRFLGKHFLNSTKLWN
jgi:hypothetical protein